MLSSLDVALSDCLGGTMPSSLDVDLSDSVPRARKPHNLSQFYIILRQHKKQIIQQLDPLVK
jgi:hypothetical protein